MSPPPRGRGVATLCAVALATAGLAACDSPRASPPALVRVAAASDLVHAWDSLGPVVQERLGPGTAVAVTFGSSGTLARQIENGAPFDVFLSADVALPEALVDSGHAAPEDLFRYGVGLLAVWTPEGSSLESQHPDPAEVEADPTAPLRVLEHPDARRVAAANPRHAPYGRLAQDVLDAAGRSGSTASRLVLAESAAQAVDLVRSRNADVGLVAAALLVGGPLAEDGRWTVVPPDLTAPLTQAGLLLARTSERTSAEAVRDALLSDEGQQILASHGFERAEGP